MVITQFKYHKDREKKDKGNAMWHRNEYVTIRYARTRNNGYEEKGAVSK